MDQAQRAPLTLGPKKKVLSFSLESSKDMSKKHKKVTIPIIGVLIFVAIICIILKLCQRQRKSAVIVTRNPQDGVTNTQYVNSGTVNSGTAAIEGSEIPRFDSEVEMTAVNDPFGESDILISTTPSLCFDPSL